MDVSASLVNARDKYFEGKFSEAIAIWNDLSKKGVSEAKAWLGSCYANGDGVGLNDSIALKYFEEAADAGNALAQANAGAFISWVAALKKILKKLLNGFKKLLIIMI